MTAAQCICGFTENPAEDETTADHLLAMFAPADDKGTDGRYHLEGDPGLTCCCGLAAASAVELDAHFLVVFTPDGAIGHDGRKHEPVAVVAEMANGETARGGKGRAVTGER